MNREELSPPSAPCSLSLDPATSPGGIEARSFAIIEAELPEPRPFSGAAWLVARRIIHAAGDTSLLTDLHIPEKAVAAGLAALKNGAVIFTDTEMVRAGIPLRRLEHFGCTTVCVLSPPEVAAEARKRGDTRARTGFSLVAEGLAGSIVAVGNAPTGLLAVLDYLEKGGEPPALVIGMPVGFVNAAESKELFLQRAKAPCILVRGRRGGSALAAAAVNALAAMLAEEAGRPDPMRWME